MIGFTRRTALRLPGVVAAFAVTNGRAGTDGRTGRGRDPSPLPPVPDPIALGRRLLAATALTIADLAPLVATAPDRLHLGIRADFDARRTRCLDGWVLAETEARLCAAAALGLRR